MSILSEFQKAKRYIKTNNGYKLQSQWTSSETVEMADGSTLEHNLGNIKGITDSFDDDSTKALSSKAGKTLMDQLAALNSSLSGLSFVVITQSEYDALPEKDPNTVYFRKEG